MYWLLLRACIYMYGKILILGVRYHDWRCFGDIHRATAGPGFGEEPQSGPSTGDLSEADMDSRKDQNLGR